MARYKIATRITDYRACANELGWQCKEEGDNSMAKWLLDFKLFKSRQTHKLLPMIITHDDDLAFTCLFDYEYVISSGNTTATFRQTVFFKYSKAIALPHFLMVPETWYHRLGTALGMQDIDFVEYPVFSKNYLLQGKDEDYIRYHFQHPEMMRFFDNQGFYSLEGVNYLMVLYVNNVILPRTEMLRLVRIGNTLHKYFAQKTPSIALPEDFNFDLPPLE